MWHLGVNENVRINWDKYDLVSVDGIIVEVKSSGDIQSWEQEKLLSLSFEIQPAFDWDSSFNTYAERMTRQSEIYVFCVHKHTGQDTTNPLDIAQ